MQHQQLPPPNPYLVGAPPPLPIPPLNSNNQPASFPSYNNNAQPGYQQQTPVNTSYPHQYQQQAQGRTGTTSSTSSPGQSPKKQGQSLQYLPQQQPQQTSPSRIPPAQAIQPQGGYTPPPLKPQLPTPTKATFQTDPTLSKLTALRQKVSLKVTEYLASIESSAPSETERLVAISRHLSANTHLLDTTLSQAKNCVSMMQKNVDLADAKIQDLQALLAQTRNRPEYDPDIDMKPSLGLEVQ